MDAMQVAYHNGLMTEADFPAQTYSYQFRWASGYDKYLRAIHYRIKSLITFNVVDSDSVEAFKQYLYNGGEEGGKGRLAVFSSGASGWKFNDYYDGPSQTGYASLLTGLPTGGAHAMTIVGYDDTVECTTSYGTSYGAFIVVNSHGTFSHDNGHYYLPYIFFTEPKDADYLLEKVLRADIEYYEPKLVFRVGVDFTSRNDLSFRLGVGDKPYSETPTSEVSVSIARNQGGEYPMQGNGASSAIEFGFNASALVESLESLDEPKFFLTVNRGNIAPRTVRSNDLVCGLTTIVAASRTLWFGRQCWRWHARYGQKHLFDCHPRRCKQFRHRLLIGWLKPSTPKQSVCGSYRQRTLRQGQTL